MFRQQRTIAKEFSISGRGLHTGDDVVVTVKPASGGEGITFVRTDLGDGARIPATIQSIAGNSLINRNTTIGKGEATVHTVEHLMAACFGLQVDNLVIEMSASEPPVPESGSYESYVTAFREAGFVNQGVPCDILEIDRAVSYSDGDVEITATPADSFRVSFTIQFDNPYIGTQYITLDVTPEIFEKEIAPARTFVLREDLDQLRRMGLAKGGSLDNAIIFSSDGMVNETPLRFPDECVRHKVLDLIGDLALLGSPIQGHVHAIKSGHASNLDFVRKLWAIKEKRHRRSSPSEEGHWDINLIEQIMPHRYPFLLVDRILQLEDKKRVVGLKNVTINEPFFVGHFPGHPIMPAVLIIEAMAQVGGVLLLNSVDNPRNYLVYFTRIDKARFRKPVLPGDQIRFEVELKALKLRVCKMQGYAYVGDELVAESELLANIVDR
jgi:UDP-3-O-[3-hydroxymyristoyl] N-acetylglucosamine deacetylase/3-hydroxyacyl-[acyl-carrier-protein] dehydratase